MTVHAAPAARRGVRGSRSLAGPAVALLIQSAHGAAAWPFGPLVVVGPGPAAASALVAAGGEPLPPRGLFLGAGPVLGRQIAAATTSDRDDRLHALFADANLAVIDDIDGLGGPERQQSFVHLLDAATARGTLFCVSLRRHPCREEQ